MPGTLVISDLHIGTRRGFCVLERPRPLEALLAAVETCDRLVLLGDVVELLESRPRTAMETALPILRAIGACVGRGRELLLVPGNHDRPLVRGWLRHHARGLSIDGRVPPDASPALARVVAALSPARVEVRYPGVELVPGTWATHGHYLSQHLVPYSTYGLVRGKRLSAPEDRAAPADYERALRHDVPRLAGRLPLPLAMATEALSELARASTMPKVKRRVFVPGMAPITSRLLSLQMRRHAIPALARVARRLAVSADTIVFGHVHRLGPLAGDDPEYWRSPWSATGFVNCGCWVYEPLLLHRARPPHPYWPGGSVRIDGAGPARAAGLLDELDVTELQRPRVRPH